jgi:glycine cleavage system H lipoate-binding protein
MSAGLVTYKLCDRAFDCEHCPLDLALSGTGRETDRRDGAGAVEFPDDLAYTPGHTWLRPAGGEASARFRFGIDALAALLVGRTAGFRCDADGRLVAAGETLGTLDVDAGGLALAAPIAGRVRRGNVALVEDPALASREPYERGWLVELAAERPEDAALLLRSEAAREQAALDLRHFRRRIALELLADPDDVGPTLADGGERLTDLRRILGADAYLRLLRDLVR